MLSLSLSENPCLFQNRSLKRNQVLCYALVGGRPCAVPPRAFSSSRLLLSSGTLHQQIHTFTMLLTHSKRALCSTLLLFRCGASARLRGTKNPSGTLGIQV